MSNKWKIFFKILYIVITLGVAVFLILVYPNAREDELRFIYLSDYIENKEFDKAVDMLSYIYNKEEVYNEKVTTNSGLVMYEGISLYEKTNKDETKSYIMNEAYICIVYDLEKLQFYGNENKTVIKVNNQEIKIVTHDYDGDGTDDSVPSLINNHYICFTIDKNAFEEVSTIELLDKDGLSVFKLENLNYDYDAEFFTAVQTFLSYCNSAYADEIFSKEENEQLKSEGAKILELNSNYQIIDTYGTSHITISNEVTKDSILFVLGFLVWVYILGDCLVGKRYIFGFIKRIFFKIKDKVKPKTAQEEALSANFFSLVTFEADICEGFDKDVIIAYECLDNKQCNFKVIINRTNDFIVKQRVHGGKYRLSKVECPDYEVLNLPEEIEVKGYTMLIKFNITNKSR